MSQRTQQPEVDAVGKAVEARVTWEARNAQLAILGARYASKGFDVASFQ
jgi:hypothetical protein